MGRVLARPREPTSSSRVGGVGRDQSPGSSRRSRRTYDLVKTMRASVLVLEALVAARRHGPASPSRRLRHRRPAHQPAPARPSRSWGPRSAWSPGTWRRAAKRLRARRSTFDTVTVTGTENVMMAAALADGETVVRNAACEPRSSDLADLLEHDGRAHPGRGRRPPSRIEGVESPARAPSTRVMPDRIETGTFVAALRHRGRRHRDPQLPSAAPARRASTSCARPASASKKGRTTCACARRAIARPDVDHAAPSRASPPTCRRSTWRS